MPTVFLFDIDGTLLLTGGAGRRAMLEAFKGLHRNERVFDGFSFAGMTDRAIARHALGQVVAEVTDAAIDGMLDAYLTRLEQELTTANDYRVLPGVKELLASLANATGIAIGLGTGNVRRGAYAKLTRGGLDGSFSFGGFGCDAEDRAELLRTGARRGAERLGRHVDECRVVVIGDTPKDVAAALAIGARCIGVGTGGYSPEELSKAGAHHAVATLDAAGTERALFEI